MENTIDPLSNDLFETFLKFDQYKNSILKVKKINFSQLSKGENFIAEAYRLEVQYLRGDGVTVTKYYFLKLAPTTPLKRKYVDDLGLMHKEIRVYIELLPQMEQLAHSVGDYTELLWPVCVGTQYYDLLLMEDLISQGYHKCDKRIGLDLEHSLLVLKAIAKFHAITVVLKDKMLIDLKNFEPFGFTQENEDLFKVIKSRMKITAELMKNWGNEWQNLQKSMEENVDVGHQMINNSCKLNANNFNVVLHGDLWTSNILFKRCAFTGNLCGVKFLDYQEVHYNSFAI
uniref:CHK domain-containing protein n=2 Tax=Rhodnius prolixus TaxID=13249 RepID=T1I4V7_RHOPR